MSARYSQAMHVPDVHAVDDLEASFVAGEGDALRREYDTHGGLVYTLCRRSLGGIARNKIIDHIRAQSRRPQLSDSVTSADAASLSSAEVDSLADRLLLADAIAQLPERPKRVIEFAFFEAHPPRDSRALQAADRYREERYSTRSCTDATSPGA